MILCVASQRVFVAVVYFVIDSVRKLLDIPSYADLLSAFEQGLLRSSSLSCCPSLPFRICNEELFAYSPKLAAS
jgi:hypothetical protein